MTELDKHAFGTFLAQLRKEKGWTQKELAECLFVSDKAVSKWERGLSLPDIALLLPLAEVLGVSVTEILEGHRMPQEQRFTAEEVEQLVQKALRFQDELPENKKARVRRFLPAYLICCAVGILEALAVWKLGLASSELGRTLLLLGAGFGAIYGAYALFWINEKLPRYYDENKISQFAQGSIHIHIPGVYFNNRNWPYVLRAFRVWSLVSPVLLPPCVAVAEQLSASRGGQWSVAVLVVYIGSLFGALVVPAKRHEAPTTE